MKCPFCGHESENQICDKCKAMIPAEETSEETQSEFKIRKKRNKESD